MYDENLLTDITICVEKYEFTCHRNVLAASSPYFKTMFTTNLYESQQSQIVLHEVEPPSVELIIQYAYTGKIEITESNVQSLLASSSLFQIASLHAACAKFMENKLDAQNSIGIHCFAHIHNCEDLCIKAKEFIEKNFMEVCNSEEFLSLSYEKISEFISSDELNVDKEEYIFEALMRWVNYDEAMRKICLRDLLPLIRFGLVASKYISDVIAKNRIVKKCKSCLTLLQNIYDFEHSPETYCGEHTFNVSLRSGMIKPEHCLLFIGGLNQSHPSINCYNPLTREAYIMSEFPEVVTTIGYFSVEDPACVVTENNTIFVAGGNYLFHENPMETPSDEDSFDDYDDDEMVRKDFYQYDNDHNKWITKAPMLFPKSNFTLAYLDGKIYCFGGLTVNQHPTEIVECYDISNNRWNYVGMMPTTLVDLSSVVYKSQIYILGGRTGVGAHNVVMKYDPKNFEWTTLAGMPTPRFNCGACVVGGEIYVAGGQIYSQSSHTINRDTLKSVEIYNIDGNQWHQGPELPEDMYNIGLALINGALYACGTTEYQRCTYRIYRYNVVCRLNFSKYQWEQLETDLCDIRDYVCVSARLHTRRLSRVFRREVDT